MKFLTLMSGASLLCLSLSACFGGNSNEPTAVNFTKTLNAYHAENPQCIVAAVDIDKDGKAGPLRIARAERPSSMDRLAKAGLMTRTEKVVGTPPKNQAFYQATPVGLADLEPSTFGGDVMKACFGNRHVNEILEIAEPVEKKGVLITKVKYSFTMKNVPDWAHTQGMKDGFAQLKFDMKAGGNTRSEDLIKTDDGWQVE